MTDAEVEIIAPESSAPMHPVARAGLDGAIDTHTLPTNPPHRPGQYSKEIADQICDAIAGGKTLRDICKLQGFPGRTTVFRWLAENIEFAQEYGAAMHWRTEGHVDEILAIADDNSGDYQTERHGQALTEPIEDKETIGRSKLRIEVRQWVMGKQMPHKYGAQIIAPATPPSRPGDNATLVVEQPAVPLDKAVESWKAERVAIGTKIT